MELTAEDFKQFFRASTTCSNIVGINLNSVYWLKSSLIFSNLMKMKNLVKLEIADVQITALQLSALVSKLSKLARLSFTWSWSSVPDAETVSAPALSERLSELSSLSIYISTADICPLDKITWMLQYCTGLTDLVIFSQFLHKDVSYSSQRFNITVMIKEMKFPKLTSLIVDIKNRTFPILLEREFLSKIFEGLRPAIVTKFWCSSYSKREFIDTPATSLDLVSISMKQPNLHIETEPLLAQQVGLSFKCEDEILNYVRSPCPNLKKLSLHHLMPCWTISEGPSNHTNHSSHNGLANICRNTDLLECLDEFSYSSNGFNESVKGLVTYNQVQRNIGSMLSTIKFKNLVKVALPLCGFIDFEDHEVLNKVTKDSMVNKRLAHDTGTYSGISFVNFFENVPALEHLEIVSCCIMRCTKGAEELLEKVTKLPKLKTLILVKIRVSFGNNSLFEKIFSCCSLLTHIHLNSLICDTQKLCRDLGIGLKKAENLKTLKVFQKQWTQFSNSLFSFLIENCLSLEQLILIDSSKAFTLKKFPVAELEKLTRKSSLCFLYITSQLLTTENIKKLKSNSRKVSSKKPFFVSRFVKEFNSDKYAFYQLSDIEGLPMVFQRSVLTINSLNTSYCSNSSVANITLDDMF